MGPNYETTLWHGVTRDFITNRKMTANMDLSLSDEVFQSNTLQCWNQINPKDNKNLELSYLETYFQALPHFS